MLCCPGYASCTVSSGKQLERGVPVTQMDIARKGQISNAVKTVAAKEKRTPEFIRRRVAEGKIVIPANINHKNLSPCEPWRL